MEVKKSFKKWISSWTSFKPSGDHSAMPSEQYDKTGKDLEEIFVSFFRQQAGNIAEHLKYEEDIIHNVVSHKDVLVEYRDEDYINNIDSFLKEYGLYKKRAEDILPIILNVLVPPEEIQHVLSKQLRINLFSGTIIRIAMHTDRKLADILKIYYEKIACMNESKNGIQREKILDLYKLSIEQVHKLQEEIKQKDNSREDQKISGKDEHAFDVHKLLDNVLSSFSIRKGKELKKFFNQASFIYSGSSIIFYGTAILLYLYFSTEINGFIARIMDAYHDDSFSLIIFGLLVTLLVYKIITFNASRIQKRSLIRTLKTIVKHHNITHDYLKKYFSNRFGFDVRKIR